ncbi:MAG: vWA domain-containing protein [Candidatus Zhuqueibacterota bacterium]
MVHPISLEYKLNKDIFPMSDRAQIGYLIIHAKPNSRTAEERAPLNLCLVMDRSASMKGAKITNVKTAICNIIDRLADTDFLSLVSFNEQAEVLVPSQEVSDKDRLKTLVNQLTAKDGTAISTGISTGLAELEQHFSDNKINRMILLTDGQTYGDEQACFELAVEAAQKDVLITALGVGDEWNEELVDGIAEMSHGHSDYIATPADIIPLFASELKTIQNVYAQNAEIVIRFPDHFSLRKISRVIPTIAELDFKTIDANTLSAALGELESGVGLSLLAEITMQPAQPGRFRLCQVDLVFDIPSENKFQQRIRQDVVAEFSADPGKSSGVAPEVMNMVERVSAYNLQTRALEAAQLGDIAGATRKLRAAATRLLDLNEVELADTALTEARALEQQGAMSAAGTKKLRYETRKLTQRL